MSMYSGEEKPEPFECSDSEFPCKDNTCVDIRRYCDGAFDCHDGSDELDCGMVTQSHYICMFGMLTAYIIAC